MSLVDLLRNPEPLPDELAEHLARRPVRRWWFRPTEHHHLIADLDRRITALEEAVRRLDRGEGNE